MMTTMAALLGGLPLALGSGTGSELRRPLGITIVGGLILSQILTLYTTPVVYLAFDRLARRFRRAAAGGRWRSAASANERDRDAPVNIAAPFIRRPVATSLLSLALLLAGALAYRILAGGAAALRWSSRSSRCRRSCRAPVRRRWRPRWPRPLERQFGRIAGVTEMTSTSLLGATTIVLQFDLNRSIDAAARDVQAAINAARSQLPPNLAYNPTYRKINPADAPIMILALTSDLLPISRVFDAADSILAQKLSQVEGVGQVFVGGGAKPAVRVQVDPNLLASSASGSTRCAPRSAPSNANTPKGELSGPKNAWTIKRQRPALRRRPVPARDRGVQERRARPPARHRAGRELGGGRAHGGTGQRQARGAPHPLPAARRQHDRDRGPL